MLRPQNEKDSKKIVLANSSQNDLQCYKIKITTK